MNILDINELESDLRHLENLLDVAVEKLTDLPHDGNQDQINADALVWIARDLAGQFAKKVEAAASAAAFERAKVARADRDAA